MAKVITSANTVSLSGIVVKDHEVRQNGNIVAFRIAHGFGRDKESLFINVTAFVKGFAKRGEQLPTNILTKGSKVLVEGFLTPNDWVDSEGKTHRDIVVVATKITENSIEDDQIPAEGVQISGDADEQTTVDADA